MVTNKQLLLGVLVFMMLWTLPANAQFLRTSYFMEGSHYRMQLNPALTPTKGYFNFPAVGSFNVAANSNTLGTQDIIDVLDNGDSFYNNPQFMNKLSGENHLNVALNTDILSFGWYKGKNFWTFNAGIRADIGAQIPKTMFEFLGDMENEQFDWSQSNIDIKKEKLNINAYTELGIGYAREINSRLTVGGKVKVLLGIGNLNLDVQQIKMNSNLPSDWNSIDINNYNKYSAEIVTKARLESSFKGMELRENTDNPNKPYVDEFKFDNFGIAGYGGAIDLGASYKVLDNLTVSAAVLDLGFIAWAKNSTHVAVSDETRKYGMHDGQMEGNMQEFVDIVNDGEVLNFELLNLQKKPDEVKERTTSLQSTMVFGAEYGLLNNWLVIGALSTTRFTKPKAQTELTLSANIRPKSWFNAAISYSMIQSAGKSFGLAVKVGPLFVGTDYMFFGNNTKTVNGFLGISIPLGAKKVN